MNKKIAMSMVLVMTAMSVMGGATYAFFSDTSTSENNTFSSGSLDLQLADSTENFTSGNVTASFGAANMAPGDCTGNQTLSMQNNGTVAANHVDIRASNSEGVIAPFLRIQAVTYDGSDILSKVSDTNLNGFVDLVDWAADPKGFENLALIDTGVSHAFVMDVCLDTSATEAVQALSDVVTVDVDLRQASHGSE